MKIIKSGLYAFLLILVVSTLIVTLIGMMSLFVVHFGAKFLFPTILFIFFWGLAWRVFYIMQLEDEE